LSFGRIALPGITLGAFLVNASLGPTLLAAAGIAIGNTLAPAAAYEALRWVRFDPRIDRLKHAVWLIVLGAVGPMAISATVGTSVLLAAGVATSETAWGTWLVWWTGDAVGVLVIAPLLFLAHFRLFPATWALRVEGAALVVCTSVTAAVVTHADLSMLYVVVPLVVWGALRFQLAGAAVTVAIASVAAIVAAASQAGPFHDLALSETMIVLQTFNAACALIGYLLAALTAERNAALAAARAAGAALEARVEARTAELSAAVQRLERSESMLEEAQGCAHIGSWEWDIATNRVSWSDELFRLYGLEPGSITVTYEDFIDRLHADDRERVAEIVQTAYRDGSPFEFDHRVVWPDGTSHWLHGRGTVAGAVDGTPVRMFGTGQDIEDRKRAEAAAQSLHDAEVRRRQALELNDDVVQGLSLAAYAIDGGDPETAVRAIRGTLASARHIVGKMLGEEEQLVAGDLIRARPALAPWKKTG
jgi:PAS domain S-box-containing protein